MSGSARLWDEGMAGRRASSGVDHDDTAGGGAGLRVRDVGRRGRGDDAPMSGSATKRAARGATAWGRAPSSGRTSLSVSRPNARKAPPTPSTVPASTCGLGGSSPSPAAVRAVMRRFERIGRGMAEGP